MGFSRQEYWSGLPFSSPGGLPDPGIEPRSPALQADSFSAEPQGKPTERQVLGNRLDSFIAETSNVGEKVDSCLKEQTACC